MSRVPACVMWSYLDSVVHLSECYRLLVYLGGCVFVVIIEVLLHSSDRGLSVVVVGVGSGCCMRLVAGLLLAVPVCFVS